MSTVSEARRIPLSGVLPALVVAAGVVLWMTAGKAWILVAGLGAFGPGLLREFGVLRDLDEFQIEAAHRAGSRAYLLGGTAMVLVVAGLEWTGRAPRFPAEWITWILVVSWLTWMFSYLMAYWGPVRTTRRVLATFGGFWLLFVILTVIGEAGGAADLLVGLVFGLAIVLPFATGIYAAGRWPRATGSLLLAFSAAGFWMFSRPSSQALSTTLLTATTLMVPLAACGLGLVARRPHAEA